jgi:hypothetical protein
VQQNSADELAEQLVSMYNGEHGVVHLEWPATRMYEAVSFEAADVIPPNAQAAVIQRDGHEPMLIAVDGARVFLITVEPPEADGHPATAETTLLTLKLGRDCVRRKVRHRTGSRGRIVSTTWHFEIAGLPLTIHARTGDEKADPRDGVARRLAGALGWHFAPKLADYRIEAL